MANVLNLALKKDIFEGLITKTNNEIPIEKTNWWTKRLKDIDTGVFKDFDIVKASCGSSNKFDFPIEKIEDRGEQYIVIVSFEKNNALNDENVPFEIEDIQDAIEDIQELINEKFKEEIKEEYTSPSVTLTEPELKEEYTPEIHLNEVSDIKQRIQELFEKFLSYEIVYTVTTPSVQIRSNGQVISTHRKIFMHRDYDMNFPFTEIEFIKYNNMTDDEYYDYVYEKLKEILNGNLVFVKKGSNMFKKISTGEECFVVKLAYKRIYLFK